MTPEQLSAAIDAWVWIDQQATTYGPGLALAGAVVFARAIRRSVAHIRHRRAVTECRRRLWHASTRAPHIPTQPGHDDQLLNACWDAWKADHPRREKP